MFAVINVWVGRERNKIKIIQILVSNVKCKKKMMTKYDGLPLFLPYWGQLLVEALGLLGKLFDVAYELSISVLELRDLFFVLVYQTFVRFQFALHFFDLSNKQNSVIIIYAKICLFMLIIPNYIFKYILSYARICSFKQIIPNYMYKFMLIYDTLC